MVFLAVGMATKERYWWLRSPVRNLAARGVVLHVIYLTFRLNILRCGNFSRNIEISRLSSLFNLKTQTKGPVESICWLSEMLRSTCE
jgi:hypothetical protein